MSYKTPNEMGRAFEARTRNALESNRYVLVQKNQWNRNYDLENDKARKREYDLVMFNPHDGQVYIIECKAHYRQDKYVSLKLVKEFVSKLKNHNGQSAKRMMVTDTDFTETAQKYADRNNIMLVNGKELSRIESNGGIANSIASRLIRTGLENLVNHFFNNSKYSNYSNNTGGG